MDVGGNTDTIGLIVLLIAIAVLLVAARGGW